MSISRFGALRPLILLSVAVGTCLWLAAVVHALSLPPSRRDGFAMMGAILATGYFVTLVLPALIIVILGRWLWFGLALAVLVVAIATDVVVPWLPWSWLTGS